MATNVNRNIPDYTTGTVSGTSGTAIVTGASTAWTSTNANGDTVANVYPNDVLVVGAQIFPIKSVDSATQITLHANLTATITGGTSYRILRYTPAPTGTTLGTLQQLLLQGTDAAPTASVAIDNGSAREKLRISGAGHPQIAVGATGAADGALFTAIDFDPATGSVDLTEVESTIASATTTDIGAVNTMKVAISGTTTITSFGTRTHVVRFIRFTGALILTQNATTLILPGGANITTAAGDCAIATSDASGNWRVRHYTRSASLSPAAGASTNVQFNSSGGMAGSSKLTWQDSVGILTVNNNPSVSPQAPDNRTIAHFAQNDATSGRVLLDGYGGHTVLTFRRATGTSAAPTAVVSNDSFGAISAFGYGTTAYNAGPDSGKVAIDFRAAQNWTDTAQGTFLTLEVTPNGSTTRTEAVRVDNTGFVGIGTTVPNAPLSVSKNAATLQAPATGTVAQLGGVDGTAARVLIDAYGSAPTLDFRRADTSAAAPSAVQLNDTLGQLIAFGYGASAYSASGRASVAMRAVENWTATAQGTYFSIFTTASGTTTLSEQLRIDSSGNLLVATGAQKIADQTGALFSLTAAQGDSSTKAATTAFVGQNAFGGLINKLRNGTMDMWQRGNGPLTVTTAGAYAADGWIVLPTGASVTAALAGNGRTGALSLFALKVTGATSVTDVIVKQRIESYMAAPLAGQTVTVQAQITNNTGGSITPTLVAAHATAADNFASVTAESANGASLQACANGATTRVAYTFAVAAGATNGLEVGFDFGNNFSTTGKSVQVTECDIRVTPGVATGLNGSPPPPELRPIGIETALNRRYFRYADGGAGTWIAGGASAQAQLLVNYPGMRGVTPTIALANSNILISDPGIANVTYSAAAMAANFIGTVSATLNFSIGAGTQTGSPTLYHVALLGTDNSISVSEEL